MRLNGKKLQSPNLELIVLPRGDGENIILKAQAVLDMTVFEELCPRPEPGIITYKNGTRKPDEDNPRFRQLIREYGEKRTAYMILKSLEATPDLEWEICDISDPDTWLKYSEELKESGFSEVEINRIIMGVLNANSLNDAKIEEARNHFLASQLPQNGSLSQVEELKIT